MEEAQQLADRVVVLAHGRVVADDTPDELGREDAASSRFRLPVFHEHCRCPRARASTAASCASAPRRRRATSPRCSSWAAARDMELERLTVTRPTLEDVYLELTEEAA